MMFVALLMLSGELKDLKLFEAKNLSANSASTIAIGIGGIDSMQVKDMTVEELKTVIREVIEETINEMVDSDEGRELKTEVREYLLSLQQRRKTGVRGISGEEVFQQLGL
jgi:hypothetical protein